MPIGERGMPSPSAKPNPLCAFVCKIVRNISLNRYMHVDFVDENTSQSINSKVSKYQFDTLDCTLEERAVLELVAKNPTMKQQELVEATGKSIATIKRIMKSLQDKNYIRRESSKRYGKWEVLA